MQAPLFDNVHELSLTIVNASESEDDKAANEAYLSLKQLCDVNEGGELDHPLQWEALGDFSEHHNNALDAYQKGLYCSKGLDLPEYTASIKFAMAEVYSEKEDYFTALKLASEAKEEALNTNDNDLKAAVNEFLTEIGNR